MTITIHPLIHLPVKPLRWTGRRKLKVLDAIKAGQLTPETATAYYDDLSLEELAEWQRHYELAGAQGLRATKMPRPNARRRAGPSC
jgi:hypothetical protein